MRKTLTAALGGTALLCSGQALAAGNSVAQAIQKLHLSAQQLLSVRDFLGTFARGTDIEASGSGLFILRDSASMNYSGEFSLSANADGSVEIERVSGPATLDASRAVTLPLKLDRKSTAQALKALGNSPALVPKPSAAPPPGTTQPIEAAPAPALAPSLPPPQLARLKLTNPQATGIVSQARATFFRDGSGYAHSFRAQIPATDLVSTPLRVSDKYFAPVQSDGVKVYRAAIVEIDSDLQIALADLETRYGCDAATCKPVHGARPVSNGNHFIKWTRVLVASVPAPLLAQIAPPPATPAIGAAQGGSPAAASSAAGTPPAPVTAPAAVPDKPRAEPSPTPSPTGGG
ncbi:MAG TPA: hypothetical protein VIM02_01100 [Rhizomicrobium sp.]|jgi:hypothetical protein